MSSLYLHFPFCESKCHYCDFYSLGKERTKSTDAFTFEAAMLGEIKMKSKGEVGKDRLQSFQKPIQTIFFGGGTPSMTAPESMEKIVRALHENFSIPKNIEWTMEANPSSVSKENLKAARSMGVNRISMGVQSLKNEQLLKLGRVHDEDSVPRALDAIFSAGIENASCDLLCGVPGQTTADLENAISRLLKFPLNHISIYLLTLPPHHSMYKDLPQETEQLKHLHFIHDALTAEGFRHYEISNFARPGHEAKHNLIYWTGGSYLGLGPSAHSFDADKKTRFKNVSSLHKWASLIAENKSPLEQQEFLTPDQHELEKWMLALRLDSGFPAEWLVTAEQKRNFASLLNEGILEAHPTHEKTYRIHHRSWPLSDAIVAKLA